MTTASLARLLDSSQLLYFDKTIAKWGLSVSTMMQLENAYVYIRLSMCEFSALSFYQAGLLTFHHSSEISQAQ